MAPQASIPPPDWFANIFAISHVAIGISRLADNLFVAVNPAFERLFGFQRAEILGHTSLELGLWPFPEERSRLISMLREKAGVTAFEARFRTRSGTLGDLRISASIAEIAGEHYLVGFLSDITQHKQAEAERDAAYRAIGHLADHLQDDIEEQRQALAREVHDEIGATLTGIRMRLATLRQPSLAPDLPEIIALLDQALHTTRNLCTRLRPPMLDDLGLAETLRWYARDWARQSGIRVETRIATLAREPADPLRIDLFRMLQELLTNVARHAAARHLRVSLAHRHEALTLRVRDDGKGFPADTTNGFGLLGIRERLRRHGGTMQVESTEQGTLVTLRIPDATP